MLLANCIRMHFAKSLLWRCKRIPTQCRVSGDPKKLFYRESFKVNFNLTLVISSSFVSLKTKSVWMQLNIEVCKEKKLCGEQKSN